MPTRNLYCIAGPSGCGKTTLMHGLANLGYREAISYTTRKCRGADDASSYHFTTCEKFETMVAKDMLADHVEYAGSYYGVSFEELDNSDFFISELEGIRTIQSVYTSRPVKVIGLTAPESVLAQRLSTRTDNSASRIEKDREVFKDLGVIADVCIESITSEDTLMRVLTFLRECNEEC